MERNAKILSLFLLDTIFSMVVFGLGNHVTSRIFANVRRATLFSRDTKATEQIMNIFCFALPLIALASQDDMVDRN